MKPVMKSVATAVCFASAACVFAVGNAAAQTAKEEIIWNDPPPKSASPAAPSSSPAATPLRDDYAKPMPLTPGTPSASASQNGVIWNDPPAKSGTATQAATAPAKAPAATGAWTEPSIPSKGKVDKTNTSIASSTLPPSVVPPMGAAAVGTCREFQQDIMIDGQRQKAHGRVCRQPDGSWKLTR